MKRRTQTNLIVVHCSATPPSMDIGVKEIDQWHKDRGWAGVGYHDVIRLDGTVEFGRQVNEIGAHVKNHNHESVGVCLVGGVDVDHKPANTFTPAQFASLMRMLRFYKALFPEAKIVGHRDLDSGKACPSFDVTEWLKHNPIKETYHG